jgi:hypothetical protein
MDNVLRKLAELDALLHTLNTKLTILDALIEEDIKVLEAIPCVQQQGSLY